MAFFRKKDKPFVEVSAPELEKQLENQERRLEQAGREFHKKKSVVSLTALELLLNGLASGKLKKEEI